MFVSRVIPVENSTGARTYVIDLLKYLNKSECSIEMLIIDDSPGRRSSIFQVSTMVHKLGQIRVMNNLRFGRFFFRYVSFFDFLKAPFGFIYYFIPINLREKILGLCFKIASILAHFLKIKSFKISTSPLINDALVNQEEIDFVESRLKTFQPDVILLNYVWLSPIFDKILNDDSILKVILTIDIVHKRTESAKKLGIPWSFSNWSFEKESQLLSKADVLLAVHDEDAKIMKRMTPQTEVLAAPMSVSKPLHNQKQIPGRCLFVGSNGQTNVQGLLWLLDHVWPLVLTEVPECSLHVCGTVCKEIKSMYQNVKFLGRIDNLDDEYSASEVIVIPLLFGSGLKIKLIEALAHGRACISTSIGVYGLEEFVNKAVLVDDTIEGFAELICTVLTNQQKREMMEYHAIEYLFEKFSPEKTYQPFVEKIFLHVNHTRTC